MADARAPGLPDPRRGHPLIAMTISPAGSDAGHSSGRRRHARLVRAAVSCAVLLLAVGAGWAQSDPPGAATAPGVVGPGYPHQDPYAPGDDRWTSKVVQSYSEALRVGWSAPASDGGSAVTAYRIHWYETADHAGTADSVDIAPSGSGFHYHYLTGLKNGVEYGVGVTAVNAVGSARVSKGATSYQIRNQGGRRPGLRDRGRDPVPAPRRRRRQNSA